MNTELSIAQCQQARLARDARFDGRFFIAVKTTKIFCRPICPATAPKETNVEYFPCAVMALDSGYRPCLRCRPDSAPGSWAWLGASTTFQRAVQLIEQGALQESNLTELSDRLGITDRYLRQLFNTHLGMSPKRYAQYHQLMFAKQLLHNSNLVVADIALASGFNSVRRFNDAFQTILKLTPSQVRKSAKVSSSVIQMQIAFRQPMNWAHMLAFYRLRAVTGVELIDEESYQRTFVHNGAQGWFKVMPANENTLSLELIIDDVSQIKSVISRIRRMLDLDANTALIEEHLSQSSLRSILSPGLRIPGVWDVWEAGVRAILGQQVSVAGAITQLNRLVAALGYSLDDTPCFGDIDNACFFPEPMSVLNSDLMFFKMPQSRKDTLHRFADFIQSNRDTDPEQWLDIKGIGPWTINYAKLRGQSNPDCFLVSDLIVNRVVEKLDPTTTSESVSPWGSYATFHCWNAYS